MNSPGNLILPILILLLLALGTVYFFVFQESALPPELIRDSEQQTTEIDGEVTITKPDRITQKPAEQGREEFQQANPSGSSQRQGVRGRVIDKNSSPIADVQIFLVESLASNPFQALRLQQMGVVYPPVVQTVSEFDGSFALGLQKVLDDKSYELRFTSERFADFTLPGVKLFEDKWYDAGDITLDFGILVSGQVTAIGASGMAVEGAEVTLRKQANGQSLISPTPGRENGILVVTDSSGRFRIENAPEGAVTISAVKDGYAKVERSGIRIRKDSLNSQDFQLPKGLAISGMVIESKTSKPLAEAKVTAIAFSSKTPLAAEDRTDEAGQFRVHGLRDGPYQLMASAPGYDTRKLPGIKAGDDQVTLVLDRLGSARIKVSRANGSLVRNYRVTVRGHFKENPDQLGLIQGAQIDRVRPQDLKDGIYEFSNLNKGKYIFEVTAKGFAKSHSEPFTVTLGAKPPLLAVTMQMGGTLKGLVTDSAGNPLSDVTVATMMNSMDENPLLALFGSLVQYRISKTWTQTDTAGRFELQQLTPGTYQLKFSHRDHYAIFIKDNAVEEGRRSDLGQIAMNRGALAWGITYVDGQASAQVKVMITKIPSTRGESGPPFMAEVISDTAGRFRSKKRLPPGRYQARAARQTLANPFLQIVDFQKTQTEFTVAAGQHEIELNFRLHTRN